MKADLVSVLLPVRNGAAHLEAALRSVLAQSHRALEVVVLDDASTDGSGDIAAAVKDSRVRVVRFDVPQGLGRVLNRGWELTEGEFIARMDADDVCEPDRLAVQVDVLRRRPALAGCGSWIRVIGAGRPFLARYPVGEHTLRAYALFDNPLAHPSVCLRRVAFEQAGLRYDEAARAAQDYELWVRALEVLPLDNVPRALLRYRQHAAAVTAQRAAESGARIAEIQRALLARLGIGADAGELAFHRFVGHGVAMTTEDECARAERWLERIVCANRDARVYDDEGLRRAVGFIWLRIALNSARVGRWAAARYRASACSAWHRPDWRERLQLEAASRLAFVRSTGGRRPGTRGASP